MTALTARRRAAILFFAVGLSGLLSACHRDKAPYTMTAKDNQAILLAIKEDHVQTVVSYIDKGMNPNSPDATGKPFLLTAAEKGDSDLVYTFVSSGAWVDTDDSDGKTPLMAAVIGGHSDIVTLLLDRKANPNLAVKRGAAQGMTPLLFAAERGNTDILLKLLKSGAAPNLKDVKGRSALMLAAASGHEQAVETLLLHRPDPKLNTDINAKDAAGKTALNYAEAKRNDAIIARLKQAGAKGNE